MTSNDFDGIASLGEQEAAQSKAPAISPEALQRAMGLINPVKNMITDDDVPAVDDNDRFAGVAERFANSRSAA